MIGSDGIQREMETAHGHIHSIIPAFYTVLLHTLYISAIKLSGVISADTPSVVRHPGSIEKYLCSRVP